LQEIGRRAAAAWSIMLTAEVDGRLSPAPNRI